MHIETVVSSQQDKVEFGTEKDRKVKEPWKNTSDIPHLIHSLDGS